ncbi:DUF2860 domain-containing protein [Vibrio sonorensis]|uniref:DUF2860 domain-containing protein n=1 Tax=Vibrio sonorensis TaxID=1004316 RepID=UPI0008DA364F|nr:DUF2860 domain-containing protein [Vibrio sonorensis]
MNHCRLGLFTLALISTGAAAMGEEPMFKPGLSGTIAINASVSSGTSQMNTSDDNAVTNDLNNNGKKESSAGVFPLGRLQYTFNDTAIFLGNSEDQIAEAQFQAELGIMHLLTKDIVITGALFSSIPGVDETWRDPYLTGQKREVTDLDTGGGRLAVDFLAPLPLTLRYAYAESEVDREDIGLSRTLTTAERASLKRDSTFHRYTLETTLPLSNSLFVAPGVQYTTRDADGNAHSNDNLSFQLGVAYASGRHSLMTTLRAGASSYDAVNPVFDKKQDSNNVGFFSVYSYEEPFRLSSSAFHIMAGYEEVDSDINFYDTESIFFSTGMSFNF